MTAPEYLTKQTMYFLGMLEFYKVYQHLTNDPQNVITNGFIGRSLDLSGDAPSEFVWTYCWCLVGLGLVRIMYASDMTNKTNWVCCFLAHAYETFFWWQATTTEAGKAAALASFGASGESLLSTVVANPKNWITSGGAEMLSVLVGPALVALCMLPFFPKKKIESIFLGSFVAGDDFDEDGEEGDDIDWIEYEWVGGEDEEITSEEDSGDVETEEEEEEEEEEQEKEDNFASMTVAELKKELKNRGLPSSGAKKVLIERLEENSK